MDRIFEARMQRTNQCIEQLKKDNEQLKKERERIEKDFADCVISNGRSQGFSLDKVIREVVENVHWEPDRAADYVSSRWAAT